MRLRHFTLGSVNVCFAQHGDDIADLEVRRATLEDTYMALVYEHETGPAGTGSTAVRAFEEDR